MDPLKMIGANSEAFKVAVSAVLMFYDSTM